MPDSGNLFQSPCRKSRPSRPDKDACAAQIDGGAEAIFVRYIVADEEGRAARHGGFAHQGVQGAALICAAGAQFEQHLASLDDEAIDGEAFGEGFASVRPLGGAAKVEADADAFMFDQQAGLVGDEGLHGGLRGVDCGGARRGAGGFASAGEFKAMGAREQKIAKAKVAQGCDRTAADNGQSSVEPVAQPVEQGEEVRIDMNPIGSVGDRDQRSIEIEEQGRAVQQG
jgi:hypothetical protein